MKKKIAWVGTFIRDEICTLDGQTLESIGGLYHGLAYAAFLAGDRFDLYPLARVGENFLPDLQNRLAQLPGVNMDLLITDPAPNTSVRLVYKSATERDEFTSPLLPPLDADDCRLLADCEGVAINMISGADITLEALLWLKEHGRGPVYFDFHTLAQGISDEGRRFYRKPEHWETWLTTPDFVQMNEHEAALLGDLAASDEQELRRFITRVLLQGPQGVSVTLGARGVLAGYRTGAHVEIRHYRHELPASAVRDIIGCGDAYGAALFTALLSGHEFFPAAEFATRIATLNTTFLGSVTAQLFEEKIKPHADFTH